MDTLLFSEFAYGRFTPTFLSFLSAVFLLSRYKISKHSFLLGLYLLFMSIAHSGFLFAYSVYAPIGAYGWYVASVAPITTLILIQFAYRFPESNFKKESKIVLIVSIILSIFAMGDYYYNASINPVISTENHFGSIYYSPFIAPLAGLSYLFVVILFLRQSAKIALHHDSDKNRFSLKRAFFPENKSSRAARNIAFLVILDVINTSSIAAFMFLQKFEYSVHNLTLNLGFLIIAFLYVVVYLNHARETITFTIKLIGIFMVTILLIFSLVGYYNIRSANNQYNIRNREIINLLPPDKLLESENSAPKRLSFVMEVSKAGKIMNNIYGSYKISDLENIRYWEIMPKIPDLINPKIQGDHFFDADNKLKKSRFLTQISGVNYFVYFHNFHDKIYAYGFDYIDYRQNIHAIAKKLIIGIIVTTVLVIALFPLLFYSGLILPLKSLIAGVKEVNDDNYDIKVPVYFNDEIGYLSDSFNKMVQSIKQSKIKLQDYAENLEEKVTERTEELLAANEEMQALNESLIDTRDQLQDKNTELTETLNVLEETQVQLIEKEKMASLGRLVSGVAHEMNTPLGISITAISHLKGSVELINKLIESQTMKRSDLITFIDKTTESLDIASKNLEKVSTLINNFKKIAVDQTVEELSEFDLMEYLEKSKESVLPKLTSYNIDLVLKGESFKIISYPGIIYQVVSNIIINAIDHAFESEANAIIEINCSHDDNNAIITISDNGKGISNENAQHIFEPFYTTNRKKGAAGLGLHIVFNFVNHKLNGTIKCDSTEGKGSTFEIRFPLGI